MSVWKTSRVIAAFAACAMVAFSGAAFANDSSIGGSGSNVQPLEDTDVRMESEAVQVLMYRNFAGYRVDFRFVNDGPKKRVTLGFPFDLGWVESPWTAPAAFRAWQDGRELEVERREDADGDPHMEWYLHEVLFPTGPSMVRVQYYANPDMGAVTPEWRPATPQRFEGMPAWWAWYPYTVHTGAGWKGTIGRSVIRYTWAEDVLGYGFAETTLGHASTGYVPFDDPEFRKIATSFTMPDGNSMQWDFRDFEPTTVGGEGCPYDVAVHFTHPYSVVATSVPEDVVVQAPVDIVSSSSWLRLGKYSYPDTAAFDGVPSSAWAENTSGSGVGEWLRIDFDSPRLVREVRVLPGYAKRTDLFYKYNRPKTLRVEFSDGTRTTLPLADEPVLQTFRVNASADWAKVTIEDVYRGTVRDETYLSEIEFGEAIAPAFLTYEQILRIDPGYVPREGATGLTSGWREEPQAAALKASSAVTPFEPLSASAREKTDLLPIGSSIGTMLALFAVIEWMRWRDGRADQNEAFESNTASVSPTTVMLPVTSSPSGPAGSTPASAEPTSW